jgi:hypothetical protein
MCCAGTGRGTNGSSPDMAFIGEGFGLSLKAKFTE